MATVYLAADVKHDRRVALKVLRPELAAVIGADRFLAEIRTTANLQHPHILPLFDSGEVDGTVFYVMPYIDGESLRDRIEREKQLPIDDALRIASEVGDALSYAHGLGVIHRDIKPENILLKSGHALVADFGIALAAAKTGGTRMTETGMSLGTPRYMSPEQAMGERDLDARSDIYALGCVTYEMLTGDAPFTASTPQAIVAKVLTEKPQPILPRRDRVPPHVEDAVLTALEKLPADRFASAADFVNALRTDHGTTTTSRTRAVQTRRGPSRALIICTAITVLAAIGGWFVGQSGARSTTNEPARLALVEPGANMAFDGARRGIDISRDGQTVVFAVSRPQGAAILARRLDGSESRVIENGIDGQLRLSPDGRFLYAGAASGSLRRLPLAGGAWTTLTGMESTPYLAFGEDSTIWWSSYLGSGTRRRTPDGRDTLVFPGTSAIAQVLPGGRFAIGVALDVGINTAAPQLMNLVTGERTNIFESPVVEVRYTQGYLLYVRPDNVIAAVPFDAKTGRVTGAHVEIATDVSVSTIGFAQWAVSENGTVVYVPGSESDLVRVSRAGVVQVLRAERRRYHSPRISPDAKRIAYDDVSIEGRDVWVFTDGTREVNRVTFQRDGHDPVWADDGKGLYYIGAVPGQTALTRHFIPLGTTAQGQPQDSPITLAYTGSFVRGTSSVVSMVPGREGRGLDVVRITPGKPTVDTLLGTTADETYGLPSPNGQWIAYTSDHTNRAEVYVRSLTGSNVQLQVSLEGATEPIWSRTGTEIFYRAGQSLVAAKLELGAEPRVIERKQLFDVSLFDAAGPHANYDVSPDGNWFVFARRGDATHIVVLQNVAELARRAARGGTAPQ